MAHPRYFLTEPGTGIRFVPEGVVSEEDPAANEA
jgi:hypothetical protein